MELGDSLGDGVGSAETDGLEVGLSVGTRETDGDAYLIERERVQLGIYFIKSCANFRRHLNITPLTDGMPVGDEDGTLDGVSVGALDTDGDDEGVLVGSIEIVGITEGTAVGTADTDGAFDGVEVGVRVGS